MSTKTTTTTMGAFAEDRRRVQGIMEAAADRQRVWWVGKDNRVLISLAFSLLTVTLPCICIVDVSF